MDRQKIIDHLIEAKPYLQEIGGPYDNVDDLISDLHDDVKVVFAEFSQGIIERPTTTDSTWVHYGRDGTTRVQLGLSNGAEIVLHFYYPEKDESGKVVEN